MPKSQRSSTGIVGLDDVLHGGLLPDRLYLVDGNPGAGKTTLALHYLLAGQRACNRHLAVLQIDAATIDNGIAG